VAAPDHNGDERPSRVGYFAAIFVSAIGHAAIFALVFFIAPRFIHPADAAPPAYTVKIVDNIPAGDLGTHLPRINRHQADEAKAAPPKQEESKVKTEPLKPELALNDDNNALKIKAPPSDSPTPTPTPEPTVEPTPTQTVEATPEPTVAPTPKPKKSAAPKPTPVKSKNNPPKAESTIAKSASTPSVAQRMALLRRKLLAEHVKDLAKAAPEDSDDDDTDDTETGPGGGGHVAARSASEGSGYGVGPGKGSMGILQDAEFLLYYKTVQDQIKKAWASMGGSNELEATVDFAINPDGSLAYAKIEKSSNDSAFDDSVVRAIRRAAPFPAPPDKFRDRFSAGVEALFQLGELKS
jgi:TonB family protein